MNNSLNIKRPLSEHNQIDYRESYGNINPTRYRGNPLAPDSYLGGTVHDHEAYLSKRSEIYTLSTTWINLLIQYLPNKQFSSTTKLGKILSSKYQWDSQAQRKTIFKFKKIPKTVLVNLV